MQGELDTAADTGYQKDVVVIRQDQTKHLPQERETGTNERGRFFFFVFSLRSLSQGTPVSTQGTPGHLRPSQESPVLFQPIESKHHLAT